MNEKLNGKTVVVGMSGGVDSSVAAFLLKQQGYNVIGLHMKGENQETREADEKRVRELCAQLNIKCEVVDYESQMQIVKDYFVKEYLSGRTPNPCVVCNREVKFKPFIDFVEKLGADNFATGHYARKTNTENGSVLLTAADETKDQTYFLCNLSKTQLEKVLFPLGDYTKSQIRKIAEENGLISAETKDSYDVCFLGSQKFKDFMDKNYPEKPGKIIDISSNKTVGKHTGISKYTIGQRKGLGIGGGMGESGDCWFVVKKNIKDNILYVAQGNGDALYSDELISNNFNWIPSKPEELTFDCLAKFRFRQKYQQVKVVVENDKVRVLFSEKQRAVTPGQYVVLYKQTENKDVFACLGGGTIDVVIKDNNILDI